MPSFVVLTPVVLSSDVLMSVVLPSGVVTMGLVELASVVGEGSSTKMIKINAIQNYSFSQISGIYIGLILCTCHMLSTTYHSMLASLRDIIRYSFTHVKMVTF